MQETLTRQIRETLAEIKQRAVPGVQYGFAVVSEVSGLRELVRREMQAANVVSFDLSEEEGAVGVSFVGVPAARL